MNDDYLVAILNGKHQITRLARLIQSPGLSLSTIVIKLQEQYIFDYSESTSI